jgi:hypothetical protein
MKRLLPILAGLLVWATSLPASTPEVRAILDKARARLGDEAALTAVKSVHFFGRIDSSDTAAPGPSSLEIIFQKPVQHRMVVSSSEGIETTALDGYFAWHRVRDGATGQVKGVRLQPDQIKRLRANTWENLYFFRGPEQGDGTITDHGEIAREGVQCRKITFSYGSGIEFVRYFDIETGRLVLTETPPVGTIREEGEIVVAGVRFPQRLLVTGAPDSEGKAQVITVTFDRIALNETFPASTFEQPLFGRAQ